MKKDISYGAVVIDKTIVFCLFIMPAGITGIIQKVILKKMKVRLNALKGK
jgi:hypothetical protein